MQDSTISIVDPFSRKKGECRELIRASPPERIQRQFDNKLLRNNASFRVSVSRVYVRRVLNPQHGTVSYLSCSNYAIVQNEFSRWFGRKQGQFNIPSFGFRFQSKFRNRNQERHTLNALRKRRAIRKDSREKGTREGGRDTLLIRAFSSSE